MHFWSATSRGREKAVGPQPTGRVAPVAVSICLRYPVGAMPAVHVRDVPEEVLDALKRRAARHERSLQRELRHLLTAIAREEPTGEPLPSIELKLSDASPTSSWRREEVYEDDGR